MWGQPPSAVLASLLAVTIDTNSFARGAMLRGQPRAAVPTWVELRANLAMPISAQEIRTQIHVLPTSPAPPLRWPAILHPQAHPIVAATRMPAPAGAPSAS